jgi:hypothetical protein
MIARSNARGVEADRVSCGHLGYALDERSVARERQPRAYRLAQLARIEPALDTR